MNPVTNPNYKALAWAYPTSPMAAALGHDRTGCYYVERGGRMAAGPFTILRDAIAAADAMHAEWGPLYRARPLPGHNLRETARV